MPWNIDSSAKLPCTNVASKVINPKITKIKVINLCFMVLPLKVDKQLLDNPALRPRPKGCKRRIMEC